jgi:hypothetical protein
VLVKFSPPSNTPAGQRWSDLLVAEHLAHEILGEAGIASVQSNILRFEDRTYLEEARFDREGLDGRMGVNSLLAIDTALYGALDGWIASATRLHQSRRIDSHTLENVRLVSTFGSLIANTDRHFGNLAFLDCYDGKFSLAPIMTCCPCCSHLSTIKSSRVFLIRVHRARKHYTPTVRRVRLRNVIGVAWPTMHGSARTSARSHQPAQAHSNALRQVVRT